MKTKSGAKKRFKMTGSGKVKAGAAGKRHGMIKRTAKFVQSARGTMVLDDSDAKIVKKYMPYNR
jgi:large subunit ribosomal protein L35